MSYAIYESFISHFDLPAFNVIHSYLPLAKNKEPDTWIIVDWIRIKFPELRISLPRVNHEKNELENFYFDERYPLKKNKWGLEEPNQGVATSPEDIDLVIVPLLVVDELGNRVGYGKGYYDKFLATCRRDCKRVGLSFFDPVNKIDDVNDLDIPLHHCVTPTEFYSF